MRLVQNPTPRMRANVIHDLMIDEARTRFDGVPGTKLIESNARKMLWVAPVAIDSPVLLQFKKLSEKSVPRNYPTQTALRFDDQDSLPGIASTARVTIGYHLDNLGTELLEVLAVCMNGKLPAWSYALAPTPTAAILPLHPRKTGASRLKPKDGILVPFRPTGDDDDGGDGDPGL